MSETKPLTVAQILAKASEVIQRDGYRPGYSKEPGVNVRTAVDRAITELGLDSSQWSWHEAYLDAIKAIREHIDDGIMNWEYKGTIVENPANVRTQQEILDLFAAVAQGA